MDKPSADLTGLSILIVEDEVMIAMMLEDLLEDLGCVVEVAPSIESAVDRLRTGALDGVLLDINVHGKKPVAIVEELASRSVPFLLVTGYGAGDADPPLIKAAPRLLKPFSRKELEQRMMEVFIDGRGGSA